ncbi:MAG: biotin/lipoyl-binding protein, partial [Psychrosphaera sp.]|nr:biotin/lipoyl-binding protein [Psychrosphaera sp.]
MDRVIENKPQQHKKLAIALALISVLALTGYALTQSGGGEQRYRVSLNTVNIATVKQGQFEDYIPLRGVMVPKQTVFLDAVLGGQVEQVYIEEGTEVKAGQPLLKLRNATLELDIISREAQVSEQLNNLSNTRILMGQYKLALIREVI